MDPLTARRTWRSLEPIHGMIYFAPEAQKAYDAIGLTGSREGYFGSRAAAMGAVPAEVVMATFFNFHPELVRRAVPAAWAAAPPEAILEARLSAAGAALRRALGEEIDAPEVGEAAALARRAAETAAERPEGRPLFAAHASLPWPEDPHLVLWHAQTLLREFRGDAHVAALTLEGLDGVEALVVHAATGEVAASVLQSSRAWSDDEWAAAVERLRRRGILDGSSSLTFTEVGRERRQWVEDRTDALSVSAYAGLGDEGCARLRELGRVVSKAVIAAGLLG
ncbi:MAG TPA: hypothetical protein VM030_08370 [Acidimicrobiales bacterium]|nr:hypothetical protein [Acidimicrobiales bacterium]